MRDTRQPAVTFVIPVYNCAGSLVRCVRSALRQRDVRVRVLVVDHGSVDGSAEVAQALATAHDGVELLRLTRAEDEAKSPSRPLNEGFAEALRSAEHPARTWVFRLDADDFLVSDRVIADQLECGQYRDLIMATLVFFDVRTRSAYEYGPRPNHRGLDRLPGKDLYAVAHHATALRVDFLTAAWPRWPDGRLYRPELETGEDLEVTCRLVAALRGDASRFAFVAAPYCYKELAEQTITESLPLRRVWRSHRWILHQHPEVTAFAILRGLAELGLSRMVGEGVARRSLQHLAGRNGHYGAMDFADISARMAELEAAIEPAG